MKKQFLAFVALLLLSVAPLFAQKNKIPIGIQWYSYRNQYKTDPIKALDLAKEHSISIMETNGAKGIKLEDFKKECEQRGISTPATSTTYGEMKNNPEAIAPKAKLLGAKFVMMPWIDHKDKDFTIEEAKEAVEVFNRVGKMLHEQGLTFCYHFHGFELIPYQNSTLLDYIIQNTNKKYVSFEMDVCWIMHGGGDPVALLKKYKKRWKLMHMKDLKAGVPVAYDGKALPSDRPALGEGRADWPNIIKMANKIKMSYLFLEDESDNELVNIPKSLKYLERFN
jgi:sugar phosphate isomerase/epimerase